jgi:hypothetical protein
VVSPENQPGNDGKYFSEVHNWDSALHRGREVHVETDEIHVESAWSSALEAEM